MMHFDELGEYSLLTLLSEKTVVPILDSIITVQRSSLTQLNLPKKWRVNQMPIVTDNLLDFYLMASYPV
jgi:hypothetical protein